MASILEALEMAQQRNKQRDVMNAQRQMPVLPIIPTNDVQPIRIDTGGGDGPSMVDTRTPHEMYLDAIDANQYVGHVPVVGPVLGYLNDQYIENYERKNPEMVVGGGINKYSTLGRIGGKGLTVEEQLQAKKEGLGLGKLFGAQDNAAGVTPAGYSLLDRITGNVPINWATQGDYIGSFPQDTGGGDGGGDIGGYREEDLSYGSFAGPTGIA